ncbi:TPA: glycosyltransferase family 1 protein, partial [Candidatus Micrarchaeota archaeon]|nr:glycosyltransferase family 1 protein [Candidatus Micrarchaeota archaeon]
MRAWLSPPLSLPSSISASGQGFRWPWQGRSGGQLSPFWVADYFRIFRKFRPEVVNIHLPSALPAAGIAARLARVPVVVFSCTVNVWPRRGLKFRGFKLVMAKLKYRPGLFFDMATAVSGAIKEKLVGLGVPPQMVKVVPTVVDPKRFKGLDREEFRREIGAQGLRLVETVVRLEWAKGVDVFLRAAADVVREFPNTLFIIVGDGNLKWRLKLERLASRLGIPDKVRFLGFRRDVPRIMAALDIFVLASRREASGGVILEAGLAGAPVVASTADGIPEYIEDGKTGLLFPVGDHRALARRILLLLSNPRLARRLAEAHRRRVLEEFSVTRLVSKMLEVYKEALESR